MEQTSIHGNKTGIFSLAIILLLVVGVTFTSFKQTAKQELMLSVHKKEVYKLELEETNLQEIKGTVEE